MLSTGLNDMAYSASAQGKDGRGIAKPSFNQETDNIILSTAPIQVDIDRLMGVHGGE